MRNEIIIARFLDRAQLSYHNKRDNISFEGNTLYSYQSALAVIDIVNNILLIDKNTVGYSVTSRKHHALLSKLKPRDMQSFYIDLTLSPNANLQAYWASLKVTITSYTRARQEWAKRFYKEECKRIVAEALSYVEYTNIDKTSKEYLEHLEITKELLKHKMLGD